jgi:hypothetical protein
LGVVILILGVLISTAFSRRGEVVIPPGGDAHLPSIGWYIFNDDFQIERYQDGSVADYVASVKIANQGDQIVSGQVRLNQPLNADNHAVYLMGFAPAGDGVAINLLIVRDPGYGLVIAAGFLVLFGMTVTFNFPNCCVFARLMPDRSMRIVGRADRRACDFEFEFGSLMTELVDKITESENGT